MKRIAIQQLKEWKNKSDRKPLILNGARQVGKTWILRQFAQSTIIIPYPHPQHKGENAKKLWTVLTSRVIILKCVFMYFRKKTEKEYIKEETEQ